MRFNERGLRQFACKQPVDKEGRLSHKAPKEGYRERVFRLKGNLLFCYRINPQGSTTDIDKPLAMFLLEHCAIQMEPMTEVPFTFSIMFHGEGDKKHYFSAQTQDACQDWVYALREASYSKIVEKILELKGRIIEMTGKDPKPELLQARSNAETLLSIYANSTKRPIGARSVRREAVKQQMAKKQTATAAAVPSISGGKPASSAASVKAPKPAQQPSSSAPSSATAKDVNLLLGDSFSNILAPSSLTPNNIPQNPTHPPSNWSQNQAAAFVNPLSANQPRIPVGFNNFPVPQNGGFQPRAASPRSVSPHAVSPVPQPGTASAASDVQLINLDPVSAVFGSAGNGNTQQAPNNNWFTSAAVDPFGSAVSPFGSAVDQFGSNVDSVDAVNRTSSRAPEQPGAPTSEPETGNLIDLGSPVLHRNTANKISIRRTEAINSMNQMRNSGQTQELPLSPTTLGAAKLTWEKFE